jgi:hypothetical protein
MISSTPTITSRRRTNAGEILDSWSDFRCRRWRPAKLRGHSVSSALPCISFHNRAEGTAGTFQRGKFPNLHSIRKRVSLKLHRKFPAHTAAKTNSTQQAWMYSRNQTTITSASEHRQLAFLHLTRRMIGNGSPTCLIALRLLIPPPASTLQVFQFIRWLVLCDCGAHSHSNV